MHYVILFLYMFRVSSLHAQPPQHDTGFVYGHFMLGGIRASAGQTMIPVVASFCFFSCA